MTQVGASMAMGVVVIGRNEGERLKRCLQSVRSVSDKVVYVDSGSDDDSVAFGRAFGASVVELDLRTPFTAARARNEGFRRLLEMQPKLKYVFFVDGDCEVMAAWLPQAVGFLDAHPDIAVVTGRRRERYPGASVYNMLCDFEWDTPVGNAKSCGGDALMRTAAFRQVDGFRADLICGEEPELCVRLRQAGWRIWRLDADMTLHDAAIHRFGQWWMRCVRAGYAFARGSQLHGAPPERHYVRESQSAWLWAVWIPVTVLGLSWFAGPWLLCLFVIYPLQVIRLARRGARTTRENLWWAGALVVGKFPEAVGQMKFLRDRSRRVQSRLIEYK